MTEDNSTQAATLAKTKTDKPRKDFPLFRHQNGQWAKKVRGKLWYFGVEPNEALDRWVHDKDDLLAGRTPRPYSQDSLTVKQLCDLFLESKEAKVASGELSQRSWDDYKKASLDVCKHLGRTAAVEHLRPDDFAKLRAQLAKGVGLKTLDGRITRSRAIFNYGSKNGLVDKSLTKLWGDQFSKPSKTSVDKQAGDTEKLFTREEILKLIEGAGVQLKAMILLGINGGLGNTDVALIEKGDIQDGWLTKKRQKTGKKRRIPLWPETLKAIENALAKRPEPANEEDSEKLFVTKYRRNWVPTAKANPVSQEFGKIAREAGIVGKGKSFYTLRHTFQTIGDETKDFIAVSAIMGHIDQTISVHYRERISDERLRAVVDHVHDWLFPPKKATRKRGGK